MKRGRAALKVLAWTCASLPLVVGGVMQACYSAVPNDGLVDAGSSSSDSGQGETAVGVVGPGVNCEAGPGDLPAANCHTPWQTGNESCLKGSSVCPAPAATCGDPNTCLPLTVNKPPVYNFRMEALHIIAPPVLTGLVQTTTITPAVTLNAPSCGYASGTTVGGFTWLLSLNTMTNSVTTGGAPSVADPYSTGYCLVDSTLEGGTAVAPLVSPAVYSDAGIPGAITFSTAPQAAILNIPVFPMVGETANPIILPIRGGEFKDVTISPDGNCIGDLNPQWASSAAASGSACQDLSPASCPKWYTNGTLGGYIKLAEAEQVYVATVQETLCALLTGLHDCTAADYSMGDYCSTDGKANSCNDSFWLAATFAANAVKINPTGAPPCK